MIVQDLLVVAVGLGGLSLLLLREFYGLVTPVAPQVADRRQVGIENFWLLRKNSFRMLVPRPPGPTMPTLIRLLTSRARTVPGNPVRARPGPRHLRSGKERNVD